MKNPLNKRYIREIKGDLGRYVVLSVFIVIMIAIVSGFQVASNSMVAAYNESFKKYNIEDGNFELANEADEELIEKIEALGVKIYNNFYLEEETEADTTMRIFVNREAVNKVCLMEGRLPEAVDEIAIDRLYADKNNWKVGDIISLSDKDITISGLVALTDYSALYQSPTDTMFDTKRFGVGVMTREGYDAIGKQRIHYCYSWKYNEQPKDKVEAKEMSDTFLKGLLLTTRLEGYIPAYNNQAIQFTGNDMGRDSTMVGVFLYIVVAILAFIFAITTSNTITKEATVIGTLRAMGYTRGELIRHYLAMPMLVTFVAAIVGNILGYTVMEDFAADLYYNSYSLTTYKMLWNKKAFVSTTIVPLIIMFLINYLMLARKFKLSPLKFIRRDLKSSKQRDAVKLKEKSGIMKRFGIRVLMQNMPNYITIVAGIFLANIIMVFGVAFPSLMKNNSDTMAENMLSKYQYMLKSPVETKSEGAEAFTAYSLKTLETRGFSEQVSLYGIEDDSNYIDIDVHDGKVYISSAYAQKYKVKAGDRITLKEEFEDKEYEFEVEGIYDYPISIAVFMNREALNEIFGFEKEYFNGYFSDAELDVDKDMIATVITKEDMDKISRQLIDSMGGMMDMFFVVGVMIFMLVIYLLSKLIVEKNAQSISMIKILGYFNGEINRLYVFTTAAVVIVSLVATMPIVDYLMRIIVEYMFFMYSGWMNYYVPASSYIFIAAAGICAYGIIAFLQMQKVKRIPMSEALKNRE